MGSSDITKMMEFIRPVKSGLELVSPLVRLYGSHIKDDLRIGVIIPSGDTYGSPTTEPVFAGRARFREYSKLQLPFLRYNAKPTPKGLKPNINRLADLLDSPPKRPRSLLARSLGSIPEELRHIALEFDSPDERSAIAICGNLSIKEAGYKKGFELLLEVQNPERFRREGDVFNQKFATRNNVEAQTHLSGDRQFAIPLAWFDASVTKEERAEYLENIQPDIVKDTRLELGSISWYTRPTADQL